MSLAITVPLVINLALGVGWIARAAPTEPTRWPLVDTWLDSVRLQFVRHEVACGDDRQEPWTPTQVAIRVEDSALHLWAYGSLEAPSTWAEGAPPVVYVYPDRDVTVGDVVAALDRLHELVPPNTIVVTELR